MAGSRAPVIHRTRWNEAWQRQGPRHIDFDGYRQTAIAVAGGGGGGSGSNLSSNWGDGGHGGSAGPGRGRPFCDWERPTWPQWRERLHPHPVTWG